MAEKPISISLDTVVLPGLETVKAYQFRPLQPMTLFSLMNRFLRPGFPPDRDYDLCLKLISKGVLKPCLSKENLATLPIKTIEQLAELVVSVSVFPDSSFFPKEREDFAVDFVLALIAAVEETCQYNLSSLVAEDLALMETRQRGTVHSHYFKPSKQPDPLAYLLQSEGYRNDLLLESEGFIELNLGYWLCRRLTVIFPWSAVLRKLDKSGIFPYLYRMKLIMSFLEKNSLFPNGEEGEYSAEQIFKTLLPTIQNWISDVFPTFSKEACIARPIQELVLVEGSTEELLLPAVLEVLGFNPYYEGIFIQSVGGKNHMIQQYANYAKHLAVPITVILDRDARSLISDLSSCCHRDKDQIFLLEDGEFEDTYALELIVKTVNSCYQPHHPLTLKLLQEMESHAFPSESSPLSSEYNGGKRVKILQALWQELGLGTFNKVEFAKHLAETIRHHDEKLVSHSMRQIVERIIKVK